MIFVSEANVIHLFHLIQRLWIHFWDLYGWNVIFAAEIQDGCQWPYWKFAYRAILVPFVSETKMMLLFYIIQRCWIHFSDLHCSMNLYSVNTLKMNIQTFYMFYEISSKTLLQNIYSITSMRKWKHSHKLSIDVSLHRWLCLWSGVHSLECLTPRGEICLCDIITWWKVFTSMGRANGIQKYIVPQG